MPAPTETRPWPPHLDWVVAPAEGMRRDLARDDEDVTCFYQWPAGARLAAELDTWIFCRTRSVADLGCGRGTLGLTACAAEAARVLFADASPVALEFVRRTLALNHLEQRASVHQHTWGEPLPDGPWEVILGGDILYRPECFAALLDTIAVSLTADGVALLSDPRITLEESLPRLAAARGLRWHAQRNAEITVIRVLRG